MTTTTKVMTAVVILGVAAMLAWGAFSGRKSEQPRPPGGNTAPGNDDSGNGTTGPDGPEPQSPEVSEVNVPPLPPKERPTSVSSDEIVKYYPVWKKVRSVADLYA